MIIRIGKAGRSFKGLGAYLLFDPKAKTSERVAWTHSVNSAHEAPELVLDEMYWTFHDSDLLKMEAGIDAGGRKLERPLKHYSLSWHPAESPDKEHMIRTAEEFLHRLGAAERQALIVAHDDKDYAHLHIVLNRVHPETGLALDESHERIKAQHFARDYEREHGIFCEERFKPRNERTPSPSREEWLAMKEAQVIGFQDEKARLTLDTDYFSRAASGQALDALEWNLLKAQHREDREAFFALGKKEFKKVRDTVFEQTREEFRDDWRNYYEACCEDAGFEVLKAMKTDILERQRASFAERKDGAMAELRETRDETYAGLLALQRGEKTELRALQAQGKHHYHLMDGPDRGAGPDMKFAPPLSFERGSNDNRRDASGWAAEAAFEPDRAEPEHRPPASL